jgi:hypothetical protein
LGGEDLMTSPTQTSGRYVIDFGDLSEDEAKRWPELYEIVRAKVKPARAKVEQRDRREEWWRHATRSPVLRAYLESHERVLATSQVTSHLALTFVPKGAVLSHTCVAFLFDRYCHFAVLQSRLHFFWATLHGSSLKTWLRYTPTACFENFPFPTPAPDADVPHLEPVGEAVYAARANYMRQADRRVVDRRRVIGGRRLVVTAAQGHDHRQRAEAHEHPSPPGRAGCALPTLPRAGRPALRSDR